MIKILFVCHGNICRSAMAEAMLRHMAGDRFHVDSAAVSREEIGNPMYPPAQRLLKQKGIPVGSHRARQVTKADLEAFDRLYYMDSSNARYLERLLPKSDKIRPLLDHPVADPWYTGDFETTYADLLEGCKAIMEEFSC